MAKNLVTLLSAYNGIISQWSDLTDVKGPLQLELPIDVGKRFFFLCARFFVTFFSQKNSLINGDKSHLSIALLRITITAIDCLQLQILIFKYEND
jgi:hypothetical protein